MIIFSGSLFEVSGTHKQHTMKKKLLILAALISGGQLLAQQQDLQKVRAIKNSPQEYINQGGELNDQLILTSPKAIREVHPDFVLYRNSDEEPIMSIDQELRKLKVLSNGDPSLYEQLKQEWISQNKEIYEELNSKEESSAKREQ